jgi:hypothetical protein
VVCREDLGIVASLRHVRFRFTRAYREVDRFVEDQVHHGFIAQEVESVLPHVVARVNQTLAGIRHTDFRKVFYDKVMPHVVGAVQELDLRHRALHLEHQALKRAHAELQNDGAAIKRWLHLS